MYVSVIYSYAKIDKHHENGMPYNFICTWEGRFLSVQQKFRQQVCRAQELTVNLFCAEEFYL